MLTLKWLFVGCGARRLDPVHNLLNTLKNVYLAFEALTDHPFEYRCWFWGNHPEVVTYDAGMKLSTTFITQQQAEASRDDMDIDDVDPMMILLQPSILSPIFFEGVRVQFVVGAGETVGSSPAWTSPGHRLSEVFHESTRCAGKGSSPNEIRLEDGNGAALVEHRQDKSRGIGDLGWYTLGDLKTLFRKCFDDGISK